jgi:hypothetical protein
MCSSTLKTEISKRSLSDFVSFHCVSLPLVSSVGLDADWHFLA